MNNTTMAEQPQETIKPRRTNLPEFDVTRFTSAPLQIEVTFEIDQPPKTTFELLSTDFVKWFDGVDSVAWDNDNSTNKRAPGQGSVRMCQMGKKTLNECINQFDAPNVFSYSVDPVKSTAKFPIYGHCAVVLIKKNEQGSVVIWRQYYRKKFHPLSLIITPMMKNMMLIKNIKNLLKMYKGRLL